MGLLCLTWTGYMVGLSRFSPSLTCSLCWVLERLSENLQIHHKIKTNPLLSKVWRSRKRTNVGCKFDISTHSVVAIIASSVLFCK